MAGSSNSPTPPYIFDPNNEPEYYVPMDRFITRPPSKLIKCAFNKWYFENWPSGFWIRLTSHPFPCACRDKPSDSLCLQLYSCTCYNYCHKNEICSHIIKVHESRDLSVLTAEEILKINDLKISDLMLDLALNDNDKYDYPGYFNTLFYFHLNLTEFHYRPQIWKGYEMEAVRHYSGANIEESRIIKVGTDKWTVTEESNIEYKMVSTFTVTEISKEDTCNQCGEHEICTVCKSCHHRLICTCNGHYFGTFCRHCHAVAMRCLPPGSNTTYQLINTPKYFRNDRSRYYFLNIENRIRHNVGVHLTHVDYRSTHYVMENGEVCFVIKNLKRKPCSCTIYQKCIICDICVHDYFCLCQDYERGYICCHIHSTLVDIKKETLVEPLVDFDVDEYIDKELQKVEGLFDESTLKLQDIAFDDRIERYVMKAVNRMNVKQKELREQKKQEEKQVKEEPMLTKEELTKKISDLFERVKNNKEQSENLKKKFTLGSESESESEPSPKAQHEDNPPADETADAQDENNLPAEEIADAQDENNPPAEEIADAQDENNPPAEETADPQNENNPPAEETADPQNENNPPADERADPQNENNPPADERMDDPQSIHSSESSNTISSVFDTVMKVGDSSSSPSISDNILDTGNVASGPSESNPPPGEYLIDEDELEMEMLVKPISSEKPLKTASKMKDWLQVKKHATLCRTETQHSISTSSEVSDIHSDTRSVSSSERPDTPLSGEFERSSTPSGSEKGASSSGLLRQAMKLKRDFSTSFDDDEEPLNPLEKSDSDLSLMRGDFEEKMRVEKKQVRRSISLNIPIDIEDPKEEQEDVEMKIEQDEADSKATESVKKRGKFE